MTLTTYKILCDENHQYWVDGVKKPGVSEILKAVGLAKDYTNVDPFYRDRGTAVHLAIQYELAGTLDEASIDSTWRGHFEGFRGAWAKYGAKPLGVEIPLYSPTWDFAGTVDLILPDRIVDYKCSKNHADARPQGELYKILVEENFGKDLPFEVWQFPGEGAFEPFPYPDGTDCAKEILNVYSDMRELHQKYK